MRVLRLLNVLKKDELEDALYGNPELRAPSSALSSAQLGPSDPSQEFIIKIGAKNRVIRGSEAESMNP
jgi:hypothetical protein